VADTSRSSCCSVGRQRSLLKFTLACKDPDERRCRLIDVGLPCWWIAKTFAKLSCSRSSARFGGRMQREVELLRDLLGPCHAMHESPRLLFCHGWHMLARIPSTICMTVNSPCVWLHPYRSVPIATGDREIACTVVLLWLQRHAKSNDNVLRACNGALGSPAAAALLIKNWDNPLRLEQGPL
jgi:hypothetical protein